MSKPSTLYRMRKDMTTNDAAARLGVSRARVLQMIEEGKLKAEKVGRDWQVDPASVEEFKRQRESS